MRSYVQVIGRNRAGHWPALFPVENEQTSFLDCMSVSYELVWHYLIKSLTKKVMLEKMKAVNQQTYRLDKPCSPEKF